MEIIIFKLSDLREMKSMASDMQAIGQSLESGAIPSELSSLKALGKSIKENPEKYKVLRAALLGAATDAERLALLKGFAISEDKLRTLALDGGPNPMSPITVITITIIITTWPGEAH